MSRPILRASDVERLIKRNFCERYYSYGVTGNGLKHLAHDISEYKESFHAGNLIEQQIGIEYEQQIKQEFHVDSGLFINIDQLTLTDLIETYPKRTQQTLTNIIDSHDDNKTEFETRLTELKNKATEKTIRVADTDQLEMLGIGLENSNRSPFYSLLVEITEEIVTDIISFIQQSTTPVPTSTVTDILPSSIVTQTNRTLGKKSPIIIYQPRMTTDIHNWTFTGAADFVALWPPEQLDNGQQQACQLRAIDAKLAREEKASHQLQATIYAAALKNISTTDTIDPQPTIEAGILTQQDDYTCPTPAQLPVFNLETRLADLYRITQSGGKLDQRHRSSYDTQQYTLENKCSTCQYNEICYTNAIESDGLQLLGLSEEIQQHLRDQFSITTLSDVAALADINTDETEYTVVDPRKPLGDQLTLRKPRVYTQLAELPSIGNKLPELIVQAKAYVQTTNSHTPNAPTNASKLYQLTSGFTSLPSEEHVSTQNDSQETDKTDEPVYKIFLNIQYDNIIDAVVAASALILDTTEQTTETVAIASDELPDYTEKSQPLELALITELFTRIHSFLTRLTDKDASAPFIQFYTYTKDEIKTLQKRLTTPLRGVSTQQLHGAQQTLNIRQNDMFNEHTETVDRSRGQDILELYRGIIGGQQTEETNIIRPIRTAIDSQIAVATPTIGAINIWDAFSPSTDALRLDNNTDWEFTPSQSRNIDDLTTDIRNVFSYQCFDNRVPVVYDSDGATLQLKTNDDRDPDSYVNSRVRKGAQLPIGYHWHTGRLLTQERHDAITDRKNGYFIKQYQSYTIEDTEYPITTDELTAIISQFTKMIAHIEDGIGYKTPINEITRSNE